MQGVPLTSFHYRKKLWGKKTAALLELKVSSFSHAARLFHGSPSFLDEKRSRPACQREPFVCDECGLTRRVSSVDSSARLRFSWGGHWQGNWDNLPNQREVWRLWRKEVVVISSVFSSMCVDFLGGLFFRDWRVPWGDRWRPPSFRTETARM